MSRSRSRGVLRHGSRWAWLALAYASAAVALVALVVPLVPTTPFALVAVFAAARGSERLHTYLVTHRTIGPLLADWRRHGAVRREAKGVATGTMAVSAAVAALTVPPPAAAAVIALLLLVATWLWLRPEPPRGDA